MRRVRTPDTVRAAVFTEETMVVDIDRGIVYGINTTATSLWIALEATEDADAAITMAAKTICTRHAIDPGTVKNDLDALLADLVHHGLIEEGP